MLARTLLIGLLLSTLTACHDPKSGGPFAVPPPKPLGHFNFSGAIAHPGPRDLKAGETVSEALLDANFSSPNSNSMTVVLIRQGPEGKTRELINVSATGQLLEPKQNYTLRDGDELMVPAPSTNPAEPGK